MGAGHGHAFDEVASVNGVTTLVKGHDHPHALSFYQLGRRACRFFLHGAFASQSPAMMQP
jgi:hypothetical protein